MQELDARDFLFFPSSVGYYTLTRIQEDNPGSAVFITSYALGDLVYPMAYIKAYHSDNLEKRVIIIADPSPKQVPVVSIPDFESTKDKIVVINAYYSGSLEYGCDIGLLRMLINTLKKYGFILYSNIIGDQRLLDGTHPLKCDLLELYAIANEIPLIVSVRSGIMDWVISTKSMKFVIYNQFIDDDYISMFTLSAWGE